MWCDLLTILLTCITYVNTVCESIWQNPNLNNGFMRLLLFGEPLHIVLDHDIGMQFCLLSK